MSEEEQAKVESATEVQPVLPAEPEIKAEEKPEVKAEEKPVEKVETKPAEKEEKKAKKSEKKTTSSVINFFSVLTFIIGLSALGLSIYNYSNPGISTTRISLGTDGNSLNFTEGSIADVANQVSSSVVSITTEIRTQSWTGSESTSKAAGTGFIISESGYIMTNKHVVEGAKKVNITLSNGDTYKDVKIVGIDPLNDSAILKVDNAKDFKPVKLGDSKTIHIGEQVIVIGNALGEYSNSVTAGIISGTGRDLYASDSNGSNYERLTDMIQTDAAINGGNSGGPIVNAAGEVIGIATAYASSSQTVGFAIPIGSVKGIIKSVLENGKYERAVLGVSYVQLNAETAEEYRLSTKLGAYLHTDSKYSTAISKGGSADKAGLKDDDIITEVNGIKIGVNGSLGTLIGEYKVGETVSLTVIRGDKSMVVNAVLQAYED